MGEDKIKKFVEHMREAGQDDETIANSLINAGNDELQVVNALGISSIDQLIDDEVDMNDIAPSVDSDGNLVFGKQTDEKKPKVEPKPKQEEAHPREPRSHRSYPKPVARSASEHEEHASAAPTTPVKKELIFDRPNEIKASNLHNPPASNTSKRPTEPVFIIKAAPIVAEKPKTLVFARPTAITATDLHGSTGSSGHLANENIINQKTASTPDAEYKKITHRTYKKIIQDVTSLKELTAGYDHEIEAGEAANTTEVKRLKTKETPIHQKPKAEESLEEIELPQEIAVTQLEAIDEQDTYQLHQVAKEMHKEVEDINKPNVDPNMTQSSPELKKVASAASGIGNSVMLKLVLIGSLVVIIVGLAISVATKITG